MNFPRIYSLSTVGIRKHYLHDYLFHPSRTDFIGSNGIGKSIVADLLQLMFVYDKEVIRFGTEGIRKEDRRIESLPYKTNTAYCFLNIELEKGRFIVIGIQINSYPRGRVIVPCVVTKNTDLNGKIEHLYLERKDILLAKDVVKDNIIPDITDLAGHLLQSKGLILTNFKNSDDIQRYYRFLYEKGILSINLSVEKNMVAFAKVIQSFSKARTLNLNGNQASKSLKEFLFEDSDEDLLLNFTSQQAELDKILKEYNRLNTDIKLLQEKQDKLITLRQQEDNYRKLFREYKKAELNTAYLTLQNLKKCEQDQRNQLFNAEIEVSAFDKKIKKLPIIETIVQSRFNEADENYLSVSQYENLRSQLEGLADKINDLRMIILPDVEEVWRSEVSAIDMQLRDTNEIKKLIAFAKPYLEKYRTLQNIEHAKQQQDDSIEKIKSSLSNEKAQKEYMVSLLAKESQETLIHWFIQHIPNLTSTQVQAVFHFATVPTEKPSRPDKTSRFIDPDELFKDFQITMDDSNKGFWLQMGALREYVVFDDDAALFQNNHSLTQSVQNLASKLRQEIIYIDEKLKEVDKIRRSKEYNREVLNETFDLSLVEYSKIEELKIAVACILQFEEKIQSLQNEKQNYEDELQTLLSRFKTRLNGSEPEVIKRELKAIRSIWDKRREKYHSYKAITQSKLESAKKAKAGIDENLQITIKSLLQQQALFNQLNNGFFTAFDEIVSDFPSELENVNEYERRYEDAFAAYKTTYISVTPIFEETKENRNLAVTLEISNQTFSFRVLEEALLGNRIRSTDDIASALHEANQNRVNMADGIRDGMIKVFDNTISRYKKCKEQIQNINTFFTGRKISGRFFFKVDFIENKTINISFVENIAYEVRKSAIQGELSFDRTIAEFIQDFFKKISKMKEEVPISRLLDSKTYFDLSATLTDQSGAEIPGSTGETYSAIALLGIARLSIVQKEQRPGLRFLILEEIGSLDNTNFNTFPAIAEEFKYQIITMAPRAFNIGLSEEWYAHHLLKGQDDENINYCPSLSYFMTKAYSEDLNTYLDKLAN